MTTSSNPFSLSRRSFLRTSSGSLFAPAIITAATTLRAQQKADSTETLKVGLIGCGGRGSGAANQALSAYDKNSKLVAIADVQDTQIDKALANLSAIHGDRVNVAPDRRYTGLDGFQKLLNSDVDVVILATPPGFRPVHLTAAVEAGKHIFCEKPMAVDAVGYRMAVAAVEKAKQKKLNLVAGFCWRYDLARVEAFKRLFDGDIGDVVATSHTYHTGPVKPMPKADTRPEGMSDVEWQIRNWYNFSWLSGDGLVEQAVHSVDKLCWAMKDVPPIAAVGVGGRQVHAEGGNIFDHFHVAYEFAGNVTCHIASRQIPNCYGDTSDVIAGTAGKLLIGKMNRDTSRPKRRTKDGGGYSPGEPVIEGAKAWRWEGGQKKDMYQIEHDALFEAIRHGEVINNGDRMMNSTMVAILGRTAAYTGKRITWEEMTKSSLDLAPEETLKWGDKFEPTPLPLPGVTAFA
ncbi:MAG: oxidoreductase domain protein [Verrucomicrobiaceae bacterium]|nr:oxidoreductase domain protein [Verrucomicrobiaceae bacterium]